MSKTIDVMGQEHGHDAREFTRGCAVCDDTYRKFGFQALEIDPEIADWRHAENYAGPNVADEIEWYTPSYSSLRSTRVAAASVREALHAFMMAMPKNPHPSFAAMADTLQGLISQLENAGKAGTQWPR